MAKTNDNVNIGLVPFSQYVNVGLEYRDESWIDVPDDYSTTDPNVCIAILILTLHHRTASQHQAHAAMMVYPIHVAVPVATGTTETRLKYAEIGPQIILGADALDREIIH